jgi:hypothetical protein
LIATAASPTLNGWMETDFRCVLPWIHLATETTGHSRLCCIADMHQPRFSKEDQNANRRNGDPQLGQKSIQHILHSPERAEVRQMMQQGEVPSSCQICKHSEKHFGISKRLSENDKWLKKLGAFPKDPSLRYIDLRLGSTCNLKCVMCSSDASTSWRTEGLQVAEQAKRTVLKDTLQNLHVRPLLAAQDRKWYAPDSPFWTDFFQHLNRVQEIYFAGGEPLIQKEHHWCLEEIIKRNVASGIKLRYNSNLTSVTDRLFQLWAPFSEIQLGVSIDNIGLRNEFIRYPLNWSQFEKNIQKVTENTKNVRMSFVYTVQVLNILDINHLLSWTPALTNPGGLSSVYFNQLHLPKYLSVKVLPAALKKLARQRWEDCADHPALQGSDFHQRWKTLIQYMESEDWSHLWPDFLEYMQILERVRSLSFLKTFPEFSEHLI